MCFPRRPPEEKRQREDIGVASNPDPRPRGLPDEPHAAKRRNSTRSIKNLPDKVAGAKLEVATTSSVRHPLASLPSPGTTQIYSIDTGSEPVENHRASPPLTQRRPWR